MVELERDAMGTQQVEDREAFRATVRKDQEAASLYLDASPSAEEAKD